MPKNELHIYKYIVTDKDKAQSSVSQIHYEDDTLYKYIQGVPKKLTNKTKSKPKLSAVGLRHEICHKWHKWY